MMTTQTGFDVRQLFTGNPDQTELDENGNPRPVTYPRTLIRMVASPMVKQDGTPVTNDDGTPAIGFTIFFAAGAPQEDGLPRIYDQRLGGIRAKNGSISWLTVPGQLILRLEEITGHRLKHTQLTSGSPEEKIADAFNQTFAGMRISFLPDPAYIPVSGSYQGKSPYKKVFYNPVTFQGRLSFEEWQELATKLEHQLATQTVNQD